MSIRKNGILSMMLTATMAISMFSLPSAMASEAKWSEEKTADGWMKVTQTGGSTLGYSTDSGVKILEDDGFAFKDMNKNDKLDPYEDWRLDYATRAQDLASKMSIEQIAGLMLEDIDYDAGTDAVSDLLLKEIKQGERFISQNLCSTLEKTFKYANDLQAMTEGIDFGIPISFGAGFRSTASQWPSHLGLGASFDPELVAEHAKIISSEMRAMDVTFAEDPQIDLVTEPRWKRFTSCFSEDPALGSDMAGAYVNAFQSTYDEDGNDLGWGNKSVLAIIKHFPGDGAAEGGREAHNAYGAFNVYPGDNFYTLLMPFKAALNLSGKTEKTAMVMPSYSIGIDANGEAIGDEAVGSGYSHYKVTELLRDELGYDGVVLTDYQIYNNCIWGVESLSTEERFEKIIEAGDDVVGCANGNYDMMIAGFKLYAEKNGDDVALKRAQESAARIITILLKAGIFENPYITSEESLAVLNDTDNTEAGYQAQLKSVIMLKNSGNIIKASANGEKPTVYIPLKYQEAATDFMTGTTTVASFVLPLDVKTASEYFNIVTDKVSTELTGEADANGNPTVGPNDILRATKEELADCDYALVMVDSPKNVGEGYDEDAQAYIPISLQYGDYVANSVYVRQTSLAGNETTVSVDSTYGQQAVKSMENRSYYGKSSKISNVSDLNLVLDTASKVDKVIVVAECDRPMIFAEFEKNVDAILVEFGGVSDKAICELVSGKVEPSGLLPCQMPANMDTVEAQYEDVPRDMECYVDADGNTYNFAYGLNWAGVISDERVTKYNVEPLSE